MTNKRWLLVAVMVSACGGHAKDDDGGRINAGRATVAARPGLELQLSNGTQGPPAADHTKPVAGTPLPDAELAALFARAKPIAVDATDTQAFAVRPASQPPPRTGQTITQPFPPVDQSLGHGSAPPSVAAATASVHVTRHAPEGELHDVPQLSVTFDQPMVAVGMPSASSPVKLVPQPKGAWRWIGTRTIVFDPEGPRFPMATTYRVEVPAGTKGVSGKPLDKPVAFSFETAAPAVTASYPHGQIRLDAPMFVELDQKISPSAMIAAIRVTAVPNHPTIKTDPWGVAKGTPVAIQLLDAAAIAKVDDVAFHDLVASRTKDDDGRWLAFRAVDRLPADSHITIAIGPRAPSAEGPNVTKLAQLIEFDTFPPLAFAGVNCAPCRPGDTMTLSFSTPLDAKTFDPKRVTIAPPLPDAEIIASGSEIAISGATRPKTNYRVVVSRGLRDEFGQELPQDIVETLPVGDPEPALFGPSGTILLDPMAAAPALHYFSTGYASLKVRLYNALPRDYEAFRNGAWSDPKRPPRRAGLTELVVKTVTGSNVLADTPIDLAPVLTGGRGNVVAVVEPSPWTDKDREPPRFVTWVQASHLAVDAYVDHAQLIAFATDLTTAAPVAGAVIELRPSGVTAKTDERGLATIPLPSNREGVAYLVAKHDRDLAIVEGNEWYAHPATPQLAWHVVDDRRLYRPGEQVSIKGWLRSIEPGPHGDVAPGTAVALVTYKVRDAQGNPIGDGSAHLTARGSFDFQYTLPKTPNLGTAQIQLVAHGALAGEWTHTIDVEEFRRPEFEVTAHADTTPLVVGGAIDVTADAKYYAGGPLAGAKTTWQLTASPTRFQPPNRDDYSFGTDDWTRFDNRAPADDLTGSWTFAARTDGIGQHVLHVAAPAVRPARPFTVTANASISDTNNQEWAAQATFLVHPSSLYVGLKAERPFVREGTPYVVSLVGVDLDGVTAPGAKISVETVRLDTAWEKGAYVTKELEPQHCAVVAAKDPVTCSFGTAKGGRYVIRASIVDARGRANTSELEFWVSGGDARPSRTVGREAVKIIADKKQYVAGNTAELLVQAPFAPAEGIVTWRRSGILKTERITMAKPTAIITVPITEDLVPNVDVQVSLVGVVPRQGATGAPDPKLPPRPAFAEGSVELAIPPKQRTLAVVVKPAVAKLAPGAKSSVTVTVRDAAGQPVPDAEVALFIADDAVLSLAGYQVADPLATFYATRASETSEYFERSYLTLAGENAIDVTGSTWKYDGHSGLKLRLAEANEMPDPNAPTMPLGKRNKVRDVVEEKPPEKDRDGDGVLDRLDRVDTEVIAVRSNFNPLAAFAPSAITTADGTATIAITMPDNLTRYRVIAIAAAGAKQFGKGESVLTVQSPLMVRPSPPRFLSFGDTFRLPIVVQNQTDAAMTVKLAVRTSNLTLSGGGGRTLTVPANDRVLVEFPAAAERVGTARIQIVAAAGDATDTAELALPVWTPATSEAFATYGVIDDAPIAQPIAMPAKVFPQFGGLEVSMASTNLQSLTDALIYLVHYPFECSEQRSSRILAIASLRDVLGAFHARDVPTRAAMEQSIATDVAWLATIQNADGGFAYWDRGTPSDPYLSVFVPFALSRAKAKGYAVPPELIASSLGFLRTIGDHIPATYSLEEHIALRAFAVYTRKLLGELDVKTAKELVLVGNVIDEYLRPEAAGWLLATLAGAPGATAERAALVQYALDHVVESAGAATFEAGYGEHGHYLLASNNRATGILLDALIQERKDLDVIPKLVTGLLAGRKGGRWISTQDNGFVLAALERYFATFEKATPDFVARVWLGADFAGDHAFHGRTTDTIQIPIAMPAVVSHDHQAVTIDKAGKGRLYYRIGMTYAPEDLRLAPVDQGFVVERRYEAVDDPKDVTRDRDGSYHVKAGARVRVSISMVTEMQRYQVALVDPLPAGFEVMNPQFAATGPIPTNEASRDRYWWWTSTWYEHQNLRDERVEAFASEVWDGVHAYDYVVRATTRGSFVAAPPKAEEMYMPETFGRGGTDRVIVE